MSQPKVAGSTPVSCTPPVALVTQRSECGSYDDEIHFVATDNLRRETTYIFLNFCTIIVLKAFFCKSCEIYHSLLPPAGSRTRVFFLEFSFRGNASPRVHVQIESYVSTCFLFDNFCQGGTLSDEENHNVNIMATTIMIAATNSGGGRC